MNNYEWLVAHKDATTDDCIEWPGSRNEKGYGRVYIPGARPYTTVRAHRVMAELVGLDTSPGREIGHWCRNRACVNPRHLRSNTRSENNRNQAVQRNNLSTGAKNVSRDRHGTLLIQLKVAGELIYSRHPDTDEGRAEVVAALQEVYDRHRLWDHIEPDTANEIREQWTRFVATGNGRVADPVATAVATEAAPASTEAAPLAAQTGSR